MLLYLALVLTAVVYVTASVGLFVFGTNLMVMSVRTWRRGRRVRDEVEPIAEVDLPTVTVQLPIYNEFYVSRRIIEAACAFDYPRDRLEIQVLDDSTDETTLIIAQAVARARARGINIVHRHRSHRVGYKAGALAAGLEDARGEYIAIFDADFIPAPDFLRRALSHFDAPNTAFVQARWGHVNREYSWLTRLQTLAIDGHFLVEQAGRGDAGYWFNFNGTAGIWRAAAIHDAGGWKADTLTEDLDLSYRAHLRGWRAVFVEQIVVPSEVPAQLTGFRRQQHRWARGSIECAVRLLPQVWRADIATKTKLQASLHLCAYFIQLLLMTLLLIYPLVVLASVKFSQFSTIFGLGYLFSLTAIAPTVFFVTGSRQGGRRWVRDLPRIMLVTVFGAGLMVNTARAALQIITRPNPAFERTAKFGLGHQVPSAGAGAGARAGTRSGSGPGANQGASSGVWQVKRYQLGTDRIVWFELALAGYAFASAAFAAYHDNWGIFIYAIIFGSGLLAVSIATLSDSWSLYRHRHRRSRAVEAERKDVLELADVGDTWPMMPAADKQRAVVVMAKRPAAGATKTRLAPALSMEQAAALYERFLIDTLTAIDARTDATLVIAVDAPESQSYFRALAPHAAQVAQVGANLSERLDAVMTACLDRGFTEVYALGSDSPDLPPGHLDAAFAALDAPDVDIVLGPTEDGGYYLIGWKRRWSSVLTDVTMSTPSVLADTLDAADRVGARVALAPSWYDIDQPDDLDRLRESLNAGNGASTSSHTADFLAQL